jgi:multidrug efflux system membrane fusion protein
MDYCAKDSAMKHYIQKLAGFALLAGLLAAAGCGKQQSAAPPPAAVPVTVATAVQKTVPVQARAIGNVEAYSTVAVKAQIAGQLVEVHFREGEDVKKGQVLFTIDRRPFEAALQQATANLTRDRARAQNARIQAQRYAKLLQEGVVSSQQNDQAIADADSTEATVRADEAAVETAKLNLAYCTIASPIDGRTGSLLVHQGNLVKENDSLLVMINQVSPIYVDFSLPEQYLADVKKYLSAGTLKVEAYVTPPSTGPASGASAYATSSAAPSAASLRVQSAPTEIGKVSFIDNAVDTSTGTIRLKATFTNQQRRLWPGQFVDVVLTLTARANATVVPAQAVQTGQNGQYVFVVKQGNTVEARPVTVGMTVGGETIIEKGVEPGEVIVTDGQIRLVPGSRVQVKG